MHTHPWETLPYQFRERLQRVIPKELYATVLDSFCHDRPTTFRTNTIKISTKDLQLELEKEHIVTEQIPWYKDAFILSHQPKDILMNTQWYKNGFIYIQSLSSMIPALILHPQPEDIICDIAAAPGSKTTQMAALMDNRGKIIANDKSHVRRYKLEANLKMQGITNTSITKLAGQTLWHHYPEYFDKTLVDVPCSMEGRINCLDSRTFEQWSVKKIKSLVQIQRFLLRSGISATKPGGTIVYSTCTLAPEENEGIINWILEKEKDAIKVEEINLQMEEILPGLTRWNDKAYIAPVNDTIRVRPSAVMEGFYVAKLKKTRSTIPKFK
ncbi:MAG: RsmB/NOP family class I SAM-dependent RNA methyltransferase [Bacteroidetes bacterium]|nr:MAG: RsmB/NOP family class I SAM-dependent RNA methyltransferase [Bacteroidota bacterium]